MDRGHGARAGHHGGLLPLDAEAGDHRPPALRRRPREGGRGRLEGRRHGGRPVSRPADPPFGLLLPDPLARRARRPVDREPRSRRPARLMADYILLAVVALSAAALGVPFLQYAGRRGNLPGYLLIVALRGGARLDRPQRDLRLDQLRPLRRAPRLRLPREPVRHPDPLRDALRGGGLPHPGPLGQVEQLAVLLLAPLVRRPRDAPHLLLRRPPHALRRLGAHEHPDLRPGRASRRTGRSPTRPR